VRKAEITAALTVLVIVVIFYFQTTELPPPIGHDVGGAFYPRLLMGGLVILSLSLLFGALTGKRTESEAPVFHVKEGGLVRVLIVIGATIAYQQIVRWFGFLLVTPLYLLLLMGLLRAGKPWLMVVVSLAVTLVVWGIFSEFLKVPLPTGIFLS